MKLQVLFVCLLLSSSALFANNVQISNVVLANDSTLNFSISWENSWRVSTAPNNHDAVWVFVKKRECASNIWSHVDLNSQVSAHTAASPLEPYIDGKDASGTKGLFIRRSADGVGNITNVAISLRLSNLPAGDYDFKVFGIEVVEIPQGAFYLGDGAALYALVDGGAGNPPFHITSEGAITAGTSAGRLRALGTTSTTYAPLSLPAAFPKGFRTFYCMKYEISQGQYVDFVNHLAADQAAARQIVSTANRTSITGTWPVLVAAAPHRAMNRLAWNDLCAYLDWVALRPMTELEFEKVCRGPSVPVANEYAWGTTLVTDANTLVNDGTANETAGDAITPGSGLANFGNNTVLGPMRVGFAAKAATNRQEAAATYYGVMEMSGNLTERIVNIRAPTYTGALGDGELATTPTPGVSDVANWPIQTAAGGVGEGLRGGSWNGANTFLRTSDRGQSATTANRATYSGGRGVR